MNDDGAGFLAAFDDDGVLQKVRELHDDQEWLALPDCGACGGTGKADPHRPAGLWSDEGRREIVQLIRESGRLDASPESAVVAVAAALTFTMKRGQP